jgi:GntR family transcriptional repressor for pyruvate dehydrogenase complex
VEVEAVGIAAENRTDTNLDQMQRFLAKIDESIAAGGSAIDSDFAFHRAISTATDNPYFERFFLGPVVIPRQSVCPKSETAEQRRLYLEQVQLEHRGNYQAIENRDVESARLNLGRHLEAAESAIAEYSSFSRPNRWHQPLPTQLLASPKPSPARRVSLRPPHRTER